MKQTNSTSKAKRNEVTASGVKRTKQPKNKKSGGEQKVDRMVSSIGMEISQSLLDGKSDRTAKRGIPNKEQSDKRAMQKRVVERAVSGAAGRGAASVQRIRPIHPQPIASGVKRGRKRNVVLEQRGWGIYNKKTSYLIDEFFRRKTDAINHLERDQKKPWSAIKHQNELKPVPVKIIILDKEITGLAKSQKARL